MLVPKHTAQKDGKHKEMVLDTDEKVPDKDAGTDKDVAVVVKALAEADAVPVPVELVAALAELALEPALASGVALAWVLEVQNDQNVVRIPPLESELIMQKMQ